MVEVKAEAVFKKLDAIYESHKKNGNRVMSDKEVREMLGLLHI